MKTTLHLNCNFNTFFNYLFNTSIEIKDYSFSTMTHFQTLLCKIPQNLDTKHLFVEITFVLDFLKKYKQYIYNVSDVIATVEQSYRHSAQSFTNIADKSLNSSSSLPEANTFGVYINSHLKRAKQLSDRADLLTELQKSKFIPLKDSFITNKKKFQIQLNNIQQSLKKALDNVYKSIAGYEKYFNKLDQAVNPTTPTNQVQVQKALTNLDEKLERTQTNYNDFHREFAKYSAQRDRTFREIDNLIQETSQKLKEIIIQAYEIDKDLDPADFNQPEIEVDISSCWVEPKEPVPTEKFYVTLLTPTICGSATLNVTDTFTLFEAKGNFWTIEDSRGNKYVVPSNNVKAKGH